MFSVPNYPRLSPKIDNVVGTEGGAPDKSGAWAPARRMDPARLEAMPTPSSAADHIQDLGAYVSASPSSFHAVHEAARRLDAEIGRASCRERV